MRPARFHALPCLPGIKQLHTCHQATRVHQADQGRGATRCKRATCIHAYRANKDMNAGAGAVRYGYGRGCGMRQLGRCNSNPRAPPRLCFCLGFEVLRLPQACATPTWPGFAHAKEHAQTLEHFMSNISCTDTKISQ